VQRAYLKLGDERVLSKAPSWFRPEYATIALVLSIVLAVGGALLGPWLIGRLPRDYFVRRREERALDPRYIARNFLGLLLLGAGVAMLVLPGQGVLTLLVGLSLLNFPGKRRLELKLLRLPRINHAVTKIRARRGQPPFELGMDHH
jgi:putative transmembrane protein PGPGW